MTTIRDQSFDLDSPGLSMSWKERVILRFCTLSVYHAYSMYTQTHMLAYVQKYSRETSVYKYIVAFTLIVLHTYSTETNTHLAVTLYE